MRLRSTARGRRLAADDDIRCGPDAGGGGGDELQVAAFDAAAVAKHRFERALPGEAKRPAMKPGAKPLRTAAGSAIVQTAVRLLRPLARRAESTLRPPTEDMRARKPCLRARRILEGWNVRFMACLD